MKNKFLFKLRSVVELEVTGKNINRFIHKLASNNIELLDIKNMHNCVRIKIKKDDYLKVIKLKSVYEINVISASGLFGIKKAISANKFVICSLILGVILLIFLTNIVSDVEVIHNSSEIRTLLKNELQEYGLKKYSIKKSFKQISEIKNKILAKYPDKIEWLEVESVGTKYVVRVELRELPEESQNTTYRHIVAKKDALIKKIYALEGMVVKEVNNYVKKGDILISGNIFLNDEIKGYVSASGEVYGEVWYTLTVEYPFTYYEERLTGKKKNVLSFKFLNKSFDLFQKFENKKSSEEVLLQSNLLPIKLVLEHQEELIVIDQVLTEEEAIDKAILIGKEKMEKQLGANEHIIDNKILKANIKEDKVIIDIFFIVYENIVDYQEIVFDIQSEMDKENN